MAGVRDDDLRPAGPWPLGVNNVAKETALPLGENGAPLALREAVNVDLDTVGWPSRRKGRTRFFDGSLTHSLWSEKDLPFGLFVNGGDLHALFPGGVVEPLGWGVGNLPLSYTLINDRIYFSNRSACGMVTMGLQVLDWAPSQPDGRPTLAAVDGFSLTRGLYQVVVTFSDVFGRESGCTHAAAIDLPDGSGIALSAIPQPAKPMETPWVNVYCTHADDQVLRLATTVPAGITTGRIETLANGRSLTTQFLAPLPAGQIVRSANGRQFVARGMEVLYSQPLRYGLYHPVSNRIRFTAPVDLMEPIGNDGLMVAAGKRTYWLSGRDPAAYEQAIRRSSGAVKYSATRVPGTVLGLDIEDDLPVWLANSGHLCVGVPGGRIVVLKEGQAVIPDADRAALMFREQDGVQQIVAALRGRRAQGLAVRDKAIAHVIYDGSAG